MANDARASERVFEVVYTEQAEAQLTLANHNAGALPTIMETLHDIACGRTFKVRRRCKVAHDIKPAIHHALCGDGPFSVIFTYDFRCQVVRSVAHLLEVVQIWSIVEAADEGMAIDYIEEQWSNSIRRFEQIRAALADTRVRIEVDEHGQRRRLPRSIQAHVPSEAFEWIEPFYAFHWQRSVDFPGNNLCLILAPEEEEAVAKNHGVLVLNGRAGTGKTVVIRERIWRHYTAYRSATGSMKETMLSVTLSDELALRALDQFATYHKAYLPDVDLPIIGNCYDGCGPTTCLPGVCIVSVRTLLKMLDAVLPPSASGWPRFFHPLTQVREAAANRQISLEVVGSKLRQEVCFNDFKAAFWPTECKRYALRKNDQLDVHAVWRELQSFVKGNMRSRHELEGEYLVFRKQTIGFSGKENMIQEVAKKYAAWCRNFNLWDRQDAALHILRRLEENESPKTPALPRIDELFVDEVQDLSSVELTILLRIADLRGLNVAGDAAQIVSDVTFRFCDFNSLLREEMHRRQLDKAKFTIHTQELAVNHRSDDGIVKLSNALLNMLKMLFPLMIDHCLPACATRRGATPAFMTRAEFCAMFVPNTDDEPRLLGADQIILVRSADALSKAERERCACATPAEVKGLEYDDVFVLDWFSTGSYQVLWEELALTLRHQELDTQRKQPLEVWQDHRHAPLHIDLKHLIVAVTRARFGLVFVESEPRCGLIEWLVGEGVLEHALMAETRRMVLIRGAQKQTSEHWMRRGNLYFDACNYELALSSYQRCDSMSAEVRQKIDLCNAYLWKRTNEAQKVNDAYAIFVRYELWRLAADCLVFLGKFEMAAEQYAKMKEYILAAQNFQKAAAIARKTKQQELFKRAGEQSMRAEDYECALECFAKALSLDEVEEAAKNGFRCDPRRWWPDQLMKHSRYTLAAKLFEECGEYSDAAGSLEKSVKDKKDNAIILSKAYELYLRDHVETGRAGSIESAGKAALKSHGALDLWNRAAKKLDEMSIKTREDELRALFPLCAAQLWKKVADYSKHGARADALVNAARSFRLSGSYADAADCWEANHELTGHDESLRQAASDWHLSNTNWDKELACLEKLGDFAGAAQNRERVAKWEKAAHYWNLACNWRNEGDCLTRAGMHHKAAEAFHRLPAIEDANDCARKIAAGVDVKSIWHLTPASSRPPWKEVQAEQLQAALAFIDAQEPSCTQNTIQSVTEFLLAIDDHCDYIACVLLGELDPLVVPCIQAIRYSSWFAKHVVEDSMNGKDTVILPDNICMSAKPFFQSNTLYFVGKDDVKREVERRAKRAFARAIHTGCHEFNDAQLLVDTIFEAQKVLAKANPAYSLVGDDIVEAFWPVRDGLSVPNCFQNTNVWNNVEDFANVVRVVFLASNNARRKDKYRSYVHKRQTDIGISDEDVVRHVRLVLEDQQQGDVFLRMCGLRYNACEHANIWALLGEWNSVCCDDPETLLERGACPRGNDVFSVACRNLWHSQQNKQQASNGGKKSKKRKGKGKEGGQIEQGNKGKAKGVFEDEQANFAKFFVRALLSERPFTERIRAARCFSLCLRKTKNSVDIVTCASLALAVFYEAIEYSSTLAMNSLLTEVERDMLQLCGFVNLLPKWRTPRETDRHRKFYFVEERCPDLVHLIDPMLGAEQLSSNFEMKRLADCRQNFVKHNCARFVKILEPILENCFDSLLKRLPRFALVALLNCNVVLGSLKKRYLSFLLENIITECKDRRASVVCGKLKSVIASASNLKKYLDTLVPSTVDDEAHQDASNHFTTVMSSLHPAYLRLYVLVRNNISLEHVGASIIKPVQWQDFDIIVPNMLDTYACKSSSVLGIKFIEREFATDGALCLRMLEQEYRLQQGDEAAWNELVNLKQIKGVNRSRGKFLVDVIVYWLPDRVVPLDIVASREVVDALFLFKNISNGRAEGRALPQGHEMDIFGKVVMEYGRKALQKCTDDDGDNIVCAYYLFLLADLSPHRSWHFTDNRSERATTRQKFWESLYAKQMEMVDAENGKNCWDTTLAVVQPLFVHVHELFCTTNGTPLDATEGIHSFRSPIMNILLDTIKKYCKECDVAWKEFDKQNQVTINIIDIGHKKASQEEAKKDKIHRKWQTAKQNLAWADVSDLFDKVAQLLGVLGEIEAPELLLGAIINGLSSMIQKNTWVDEHLLIFVKRILEVVSFYSCGEERARCGIFIARCCFGRLEASKMLNDVKIPLVDWLSQEDFLYFLMGNTRFLTKRAHDIITQMDDDKRGVVENEKYRVHGESVSPRKPAPSEAPSSLSDNEENELPTDFRELRHSLSSEKLISNVDVVCDASSAA